MRQFFYMVGHTIVGDDLEADKIFLQESDAISWGRRLATNNSEYTVHLYKQEITRTGTLEFVKYLSPYKAPKIESFDWNQFERDLTKEGK